MLSKRRIKGDELAENTEARSGTGFMIHSFTGNKRRKINRLVFYETLFWFFESSGWYHKDFAALTRAEAQQYCEIGAPQRILIGGGVGLGVPGLLDGAITRLPGILANYLPELDSPALHAMIGPPALGADAGPLGAIALAVDAASSLDWARRRRPDGSTATCGDA